MSFIQVFRPKKNFSMFGFFSWQNSANFKRARFGRAFDHFFVLARQPSVEVVFLFQKNICCCFNRTCCLEFSLIVFVLSVDVILFCQIEDVREDEDTAVTKIENSSKNTSSVQTAVATKKSQ